MNRNALYCFCNFFVSLKLFSSEKNFLIFNKNPSSFLWEILQAEVIIFTERMKKLRHREVRGLASSPRASQGPTDDRQTSGSSFRWRSGEACREQTVPTPRTREPLAGPVVGRAMDAQTKRLGIVRRELCWEPSLLRRQPQVQRGHCSPPTLGLGAAGLSLALPKD